MAKGSGSAGRTFAGKSGLIKARNLKPGDTIRERATSQSVGFTVREMRPAGPNLRRTGTTHTVVAQRGTGKNWYTASYNASTGQIGRITRTG